MTSRKILARYRLVTPLFCAGADPSRPELRLPSLKGMLRFWWRALAWSHYGGNLSCVKTAEDELFGSGGGDSRRSRVVMRLRSSQYDTVDKGKKLRHSDGRVVGHGVRYLGFGLMGAFGKKGGELERGCLLPLEFDLLCRCVDVDNHAFELLCRALEVMGTIGGFGARSRRGFGSLVLTQLEVDRTTWRPPTTAEELKKRIQVLTKNTLREGLPPYTAFCSKTRHVVVGPDDADDAKVTDPLALLDLVGRELVRFRAFGDKGKILGGAAASEFNFRFDHDLMRPVAESQKTVTSHPQRVAFGLPHNYFFSSVGERGTKVKCEPNGKDRRGSPLFIHIHLVGETPVVVLSFLPALFLPREGPQGNRAKIKIGRSRVRHTDERTLYKPVEDFLERMKGGGRKEKFGRALEVRS